MATTKRAAMLSDEQLDEMLVDVRRDLVPYSDLEQAIAQAREANALRGKAIRFDLDHAGIEAREQDAVELVKLRAEVERLRAENAKLAAKMRRGRTRYR